METKELISTECQKAVDSIKLSDETKALLKCKAMLSDVYQTVSNVMLKTYENNSDDYESKFTDKYNDLDKELCDIINIVMDTRAIESNFKEI